MQSSPSRFGLLVFQTWVIDDQQKGLWHARLEKRRGIRNGFLAGLCMVLVSLLLLPVGRSQALEVSIETSNPEVAEQSQFEIAIYADDASDLISMGVAVTFDPDILRVITATKNQDPTTGFILDPDGDPGTTADQISEPAVKIDNTAGTVTMVGGRMMGSTTTGLSGKVLLGSITFEGLQIGSSNIHVDLANYHPEHPAKTFANFVTITGTVDEPTNLGDLAAIAILSDQDLDGLPDSHETGIYGTDPSLADTDGDGIDDGEELAAWDALDCSGLGCGGCWDCDIDNDGQANNLLDADADGDGFLDGEELLAGYDPADAGDHPAATAVPALNAFGILMAIILLIGVAVMSEKKGSSGIRRHESFFLKWLSSLLSWRPPVPVMRPDRFIITRRMKTPSRPLPILKTAILTICGPQITPFMVPALHPTPMTTRVNTFS